MTNLEIIKKLDTIREELLDIQTELPQLSKRDKDQCEIYWAIGESCGKLTEYRHRLSKKLWDELLTK